MKSRPVLIFLTSILTGILFLTSCGSEVLAQRVSTPSSTKVNDKLVKVQTTLDRIITQFENLVGRVDKILDNLQKKIVRAKAGGKNVSRAEFLMKDSRERLVKIQSETADLKTMREVSKTRADYLKVRDQVKLVKDNFSSIKNNLTEIISILKGNDSRIPNPASQSGISN